MSDPYPKDVHLKDVHPNHAHPSDSTSVLGRRVLAHLIDFVLLVVVIAIAISSRVKIVENVTTNFCSGAEQGQCVVIGNQAVTFSNAARAEATYVLLGFWTVMGVIEGVWGAFVGKRIMGLRVVGREGGRPGPLRGAIRGALMLVDSALFVGFVGLVLVFVTRPRRRLGDFAAGTLVVRADAAVVDANVDPIEWDEQKSVYVFRDPVSGARQIWDPATEQWMPLD